MNTNGINAGYLNYLNNSTMRERAQLDNDMLRFRVAETIKAANARPIAGKVLMDAMGGQGGGAPAMPMPPQPGQSSAPPAQQQPAQGPTPQGPANGQPAPAVQPWKTFDDHVAAPGPAALPDAPAAPAALPSVPQRKLDLGSIIKTMKQNNVSDDMTLSVLDDLLPFMNAENKVEMDALKAQLNIARETDRMTIAQMRNDLGNRELDRKTARDEWQKGNSQQRAQYLKDKIAAENRRTDMFIQQNQTRVKNADAKASMDRLKALNMQLGRAQQLIPGLENMVVNGTQDVRENAAARLEAVNADVDKLQQQLDAETRTFLGAAEKGDQAPARPTNTGGKKKPDGKTRPPMPTDPGYDYKFDEGRGVWQRSPKR